MEDEIERLLFTCNDVHVYKIPPRQTSAGYKAGDWEGNLIWNGRCTVFGKGEICSIKLEDKTNGSLFATCTVNTAPGAPQAVERVLDSSRYFVLRIEDGSGRHAFIGMGFTERSDAFDFQVALQDYAKQIQREHEAPVESNVPATNYSLQEGQSIKIDIKGKVKTAKPSASAGPGSSGSSIGTLPKPKGAGLLPPPSAKNAQAPAAGTTDMFGDFASAQKQPQQQSSGDDWMKF
eukprot:ANDGO_01791.mRNA.1 NECAP-like protein CG9132